MGLNFQSFTKKPFKDRLKDTGFLLKNSFTVVGKDKDIKKPTIHMAVFSAIIRILFFGAVLTFLVGEFVLLGVLLLAVMIFVLLPFKFFYNIRQKADQSWIVYNTICGQDISYKDAHKHTKPEKGKLRIVAFVEMMVKISKNQGESGGIRGLIIKLALSFLAEVWDLLSHYLLPAIVVEQKSLKETVPQIKSLRNNVPATLTGVFGIDFAGHIINSLLGIIYLFAILISVGIGYLIATFTQVTVFTIAGFSFSWVPVFLMVFLVSIIGGIYKKVVESIKVIYFTIFYTSIMHPMNITEDMRGELTNYLLMKKSDFKEKPKLTPQQKYIKELTDYIKRSKDMGHSEEETKQFLMSKGHSEKDINKAINNLNQNQKD